MSLNPSRVATEQAQLGWEQSQIASQQQLLPQETAFREQQIGAESSLIPSQTQTALQQEEYTQAQLSANLGLLPGETALRSEQISSERELLPSTTQTALIENQLAQGVAQNKLDLLPSQKAVASSFYEQALNGVNTRDRMNMATADVAQAFAQSEEANKRAAMRMGIDPTSGRFAESMKASSLDRAKALSGARTTARREAEDEKFQRASAAMAYGIGG